MEARADHSGHTGHSPTAIASSLVLSGGRGMSRDRSKAILATPCQVAGLEISRRPGLTNEMLGKTG